jgi:hypothetical protein
MDTSTRSLLGCIVLAAMSAGCATSSNTREGRIPGERQDCRAAAGRLAEGKSTVETFGTLAWCDETGPDALAAVWHKPLPEGARLDKFLFASSNIRDARIFSAAYAVASDAKRRPAERGAGLLLLVAQLDSSVTVGLVSPGKNERWRAGLARESRPVQIPGTRPLPADARERVTALARTLRTGRSTGATASSREPLIAAVQATELALQRLPRMSAQSRSQRGR